MKKIIIISLIGILITAFSYAQAYHRKLIDTAIVITYRNPDQVKALNSLLKSGWKIKSVMPEVVSNSGGGSKGAPDSYGLVLIVLTGYSAWLPGDGM